MAEAIATVAAISSVVQLIGFTAKLAEYAHRVIDASVDALPYASETELLAAQYEEIGKKSAKRSLDETEESEEQTISRLGSTCRLQSEKLLQKLGKLKIDDDSTGLKRLSDGFRKGVVYLTKRHDIERSRKYLQEINSQLTTAMLQSILAKQQSYHPSRADSIQDGADSRQSDLHKVLAVIDAHVLRQRSDRIINSLSFPEVLARHSAIPPAYESTYRWALTENSLPLNPWIREGTGIFWICGKAGSGKSTLMKYIAASEEMEDLLHQWRSSSNDKDPILVSYFFWYAGTPLQKSVCGLFRTLLVELLSRTPELTQVAFPRLFERRKETENKKHTQIQWTEGELAAGLKALASHQAKEDRQRFCFLIDGLDEYNGNGSKLVAVLRDLAGNTAIKLCVSSRPWNAFRSAFESTVPTLRLEDLSRPDIDLFVDGNLRGPLALSQGVQQAALTGEAELLMEEIVEKAEGVFLWVFLVVKSVLAGLDEMDTVSMLLYRVQQFPSDLEDFFRAILDRAESVYSGHTHQSLKLACLYAEPDCLEEAREASNFLDFWFIRQDPRGIHDPNFFHNTQPWPVPNDMKAWERMRRETQATLSAACKDLLYIPERSEGNPLWWKVEFLHRTVYEFLQTDEMQSLIEANVPAHFIDGRILHLLSLGRLNLTSDTLYFGVRQAVRILWHMPKCFVTDKYAEGWEDIARHLQTGEFAWHEILIWLVAFRRNVFVLQSLRGLRKGYSRDTPKPWEDGEPVGFDPWDAAFGDQSQHPFAAHHTSLAVIKELCRTGIVDLHGSGQRLALWRRYLPKWAKCIPSELPRIRKSWKSKEARTAWDLAKWLMSHDMPFPLGQRVWRTSSLDDEGDQRDDQWGGCTAAEFMEDVVPPEWLRECEITRHLAEGSRIGQASQT
jgi:hypothetical protein